MPTHHLRRTTVRTTVLLALTVGLGLGLGCEDEGDTIIVDGLDCGLIRNDLIGDWVVSFVAGVTTLLNCDDVPPSDGIAVGVTAGSVTYSNVSVVASVSSTSFVVFSDGPNGLPDELIGSVEADSCLALVQIWENDDDAWMQCIGTFDRSNGTIRATCDSADLETTGDRAPDVACDLANSLFVDILVP
jgi:hypothetical protein